MAMGAVPRSFQNLGSRKTIPYPLPPSAWSCSRKKRLAVTPRAIERNSDWESVPPIHRLHCLNQRGGPTDPRRVGFNRAALPDITPDINSDIHSFELFSIS